MAITTSEQATVIRQLKDEYGPTDRESIEHTAEPYGLYWMRWHGDDHLADRNLFIRPDGTRLSWRMIPGWR